MEIITGKEIALSRARQQLQGSRVLTKGELDHNANQLAQWIAEHIPNDVEFVLVLAPKDSNEFGTCASLPSTSHQRCEQILHKAEKRVRKARVG